MNEKKLITKILTFIVIEGILATSIQYFTNKLLETRTDKNLSYGLALLLGILIVAVIYIVVKKVYETKRRKKKNMDIRNEIHSLQLTLLQDYLELRLQDYYGENWIEEVLDCANMKVRNNNHKTTYQTIVEKADKYGKMVVTKKDMDLTLLVALLQYDFTTVCRVGSTNIYRNYIRAIAEDKNNYISHNSDLENKLNNCIMQMTALKSIRSFIDYLKRSEWVCVNKDAFLTKYAEKVESIVKCCFSNMEDMDQQEAEYQSAINLYVQNIYQNAVGNQAAYVPLAYKKTDSSLQEYSLENFVSLAKGAVLVADAGYGKTWSLMELAGRCANDYLCKKECLPLFIEMGIVSSDSAEPLRDTINNEVFGGQLSDEKLETFLKKTELVLFIDGMDEATDEVAENTRKELMSLYKYDNIRIFGGTRGDHKAKFPKELDQFAICDLNPEQLEQFIRRNLDPEQREGAIFDWIIDENSYFKNIRTPFYITCYCKAMECGMDKPASRLEIVEFCLNGIIKREISKGFRVTERIINEILQGICKGLQIREQSSGKEVNYILEMEVLRTLEEEISYDIKIYERIPAVIDNLIELQILARLEKNRKYYIGFYEKQYRLIFDTLEETEDDFF